MPTTAAATAWVGYDFQLLDEEIPAESHDVAVDIVITETDRIVVHHRKATKAPAVARFGKKQ